MWVLPVSARLHTPGIAGLCLGERRRFGALQERCRLPSLGVLKLSDKHMHTEVCDCINICLNCMLCTETHTRTPLISTVFSLRSPFLAWRLPFLLFIILECSITTPGLTSYPRGHCRHEGCSKLGNWPYIQTNIHNNIHKINQIHKHTYTGSLGGVAK